MEDELQPDKVKQKGVSKSLKGHPKVSKTNPVYARSRSKRAAKGEGKLSPMVYHQSIGYQL